jgi:hypothetical protein
MFKKGAWLGQVPLVVGPSSWGYGMVFPAAPPAHTPVPPYFGEWGVVGEGGAIIDSGEVGPFDTIDEAFSAAADAAIEHGATELPTNGFAQVKDSRGVGVGPVT